MATLQRADGTTEKVEPKDGTTFSLEEMQALVGGYIEPVFLPGDTMMLVDEEGRLKKRPVNEFASNLMFATIAGDVLFGTRRELGFEEEEDEEEGE
jgi:hypothetical protein